MGRGGDDSVVIADDRNDRNLEIFVAWSLPDEEGIGRDDVLRIVAERLGPQSPSRNS